MSEPWQAPWAKGARLAVCESCGARCAASILRDGRCTHCRLVAHQAVAGAAAAIAAVRESADEPARLFDV